MRRRAFILTALFCAALCTAGGRAWARAASEHGKGDLPWFTIERKTQSFDLGRSRRLTIESTCGDVDVVPGESRVRVEATLRAQGKDLADAREHAGTISLRTGRDANDGLRIISERGRMKENTVVNLVVHVPADVQLRVESTVGTVHVRGTQRPLTVNADVGDVRLEELRQPVDVHCRVGDVVLRDVQSKRIDLHVGVGEISVRFAEPFSGRLVCRAGVGSIRVEVPKGSACRVATRVGMGSLDDSVPTTALARTGPGLIDLDVGTGDLHLVGAE